MSYYIALSFLSNIDKGRFNKLERRELLRAESRRILSRFEGRQINENDIERDKNGRPFLTGSKFDFNISHSGNLTAVSYVKSEISGFRTGCDIELMRPRASIKEISENYFSDTENKYIFSHSELVLRRFYEIWTLKECYLKLNGFSVFEMQSCPSFINDEGNFFFISDGANPLAFRLYELLSDSGECYILAAALEGEGQIQPEIRIFSQSSLDCKKTAEIKAAPSPAQTVKPKI